MQRRVFYGETSMARRILPRIVAIIVLTAVVYLVWRYGFQRKAPPGGVIRVSGTVEATEIMIAPKINGRIIALPIDEGSEVRRGDLMARLDTGELQAQVNQAQASLGVARARWEAARNGSRPEQIAQARAQLVQAQAMVAGANDAVLNSRKNYRKVTDLKAQEDAARTRYETSVSALQQAEEALRLVRAGPRVEQVEQARSAVDQAQVSLSKAEGDARRMQALYEQGAISAQQWDAATAARDVARAQLDQARAHLADLEAGARPEEIRQAELAVKQAKANQEGAKLALDSAREAYRDRISSKSQYDTARANYEAALAQTRAARAQLDLLLAGTRPEDLRAAQKQVEQAQATLRFFRAQFNNAFIYAPTGGVITTKVAELGETVAPGAPIAVLSDLDHVWLRVYVPENVYGKVKIGQRADITVDSAPHRVFRGTVVEIASEAEFTPKNVQTEQERVKLVFGVKITLDNRDHLLKPGMPADAVIKIGDF
jgi:HlyD family secretion protein